MAAFEVLMANDAIRNLVREGKTRQIRNVITTARIDGMQTMEHDLNRLIAAGLITPEVGLAAAAYPKEIVARGPNEQLLASLVGGRIFNGTALPPPSPVR